MGCHQGSHPPSQACGRHRSVDVREVLNTLLYQNHSGCQWDMLPHDLLPRSTVWDDFARRRDDGTLDVILQALRRRVRIGAGRDPEPSAAIIDSQGAPTAVGGEQCGYDGGKKVKGRKRHIITDTMGLLLMVMVTAAGADDGAAAPDLLGRLDGAATPRLRVIRGDQKYHNHGLIEWQLKNRPVYHVVVASRPKGFVPLAKRWAVERNFAWLLRDRRHVRDFERQVASSEAGSGSAGSI